MVDLRVSSFSSCWQDCPLKILPYINKSGPTTTTKKRAKQNKKKSSVLKQVGQTKGPSDIREGRAENFFFLLFFFSTFETTKIWFWSTKKVHEQDLNQMCSWIKSVASCELYQVYTCHEFHVLSTYVMYLRACNCKWWVCWTKYGFLPPPILIDHLRMKVLRS